MVLTSEEFEKLQDERTSEGLRKQPKRESAPSEVPEEIETEPTEE